jgi:hypothetical protein
MEYQVYVWEVGNNISSTIEIYKSEECDIAGLMSVETNNSISKGERITF